MQCRLCTFKTTSSLTLPYLASCQTWRQKQENFCKMSSNNCQLPLPTLPPCNFFFFFFFPMCRLSHLSSHSISPFLGKLSLPLTCSRYLGEALMVWISQVLPTLHQGPWITFAPPGAPGQGQRKFSPYSLH